MTFNDQIADHSKVLELRLWEIDQELAEVPPARAITPTPARGLGQLAELAGPTANMSPTSHSRDFHNEILSSYRSLRVRNLETERAFFRAQKADADRGFLRCDYQAALGSDDGSPPQGLFLLWYAVPAAPYHAIYSAALKARRVRNISPTPYTGVEESPGDKYLDLYREQRSN